MGKKRRTRKNAGKAVLKTNRGRRFPPEVLTADEVKRLMDACSTESVTGIRNRVLIATLYRAGLRIAEALSLLPKDVDLDSGTIRVLHGKGDRSRTVGVDTGATDLIKEWLAVRNRSEPGIGARLFCTIYGSPMSTSYMRQLLPRLAKRAGIGYLLRQA